MYFNINKQLNADDQEPKASAAVEETTATVEEATATTNEPEQEKKSTKKEYPVDTPHDDFDWSRDKRNVSAYSASEKVKYDEVYDNTFKQINDGEMLEATIESLTSTDAVVNIGVKSDGLI